MLGGPRASLTTVVGNGDNPHQRGRFRGRQHEQNDDQHLLLAKKGEYQLYISYAADRGRDGATAHLDIGQLRRALRHAARPATRASSVCPILPHGPSGGDTL